MKKMNMKKAVVVVSVVLMVGLSGSAFAGWGEGKMGYGGHGGHGDMRPALSAEDQKSFDAEREAFMSATRDLRQEIYSKRLELRSEMAKKEVDVERSSALQKEISGLEARFDQEKLRHRIAMQKIDPDFGMYRGGHGKGHKGMGEHRQRRCGNW